jgi:hypothetical protein
LWNLVGSRAFHLIFLIQGCPVSGPAITFTMRYEDWDILLFPAGLESKVPMKEFKVACHVVPDGELSHAHGSQGLPVMTCFIPGIAVGAPFQISVHNWHTPEVSQFTRTYSKHAELVKFEARIFIDGRVVALVCH